MFVITNNEDPQLIGPFETLQDANSFMTKLEGMARGFYVFEIYEVIEPTEWMEENMSDILMAQY